ncbi:MAG: hypothetical protein K2N33_05225 [Clostridia bacterium]|nr:hypothetical protein [Clostridia bacterium]
MDNKTQIEVIEKSQLLSEIMLCIKDCFECDISCEEQSILLTFGSGQKFQLKLSNA